MGQHAVIQRKQEDESEQNMCSFDPQTESSAASFYSPMSQQDTACFTPATPARQSPMSDFTQIPAYAPGVTRNPAMSSMFSDEGADMNAEAEQEAIRQAALELRDSSVYDANRAVADMEQQIDGVLSDVSIPVAQKVMQVNELVYSGNTKAEQIKDRLAQHTTDSFPPDMSFNTIHMQVAEVLDVGAMGANEKLDMLTMLDQTVQTTRRTVGDLDQRVKEILNDSGISARKKITLVNEAINDTSTRVDQLKGDIMLCEPVLTANKGLDGARAEIANLQKQGTARANAHLMADPGVAAHMAQMQQKINNSSGSLTIDASNMYEDKKFRGHMTGALDTLMSLPAGLELVTDLMDSKYKTDITPTVFGCAEGTATNRKALQQANGMPGEGSDTEVKINPDFADDTFAAYDATGEKLPTPLWLALGHELIHAEHNASGQSQMKMNVGDPIWDNKEEEQTIATGALSENQLRAQAGMQGERYGHTGEQVKPMSNSDLQGCGLKKKDDRAKKPRS